MGWHLNFWLHSSFWSGCHVLTDLTNHSEVSTLRAIKKLCLLLQRSVKQLSFRTEWQLTFPYFSLEAKLKSKSTLEKARWKFCREIHFIVAHVDANIFCMCDWGGYMQLLGLNQRNKTKGNIIIRLWISGNSYKIWIKSFHLQS